MHDYFEQFATIDSLHAAENLKNVVKKTSLDYNYHLSEKFDAEVYLKREDQQIVRSYKLRGAYNKISQLNAEQKEAGVVCASAGNHAQGVAYSCKKLGIKGVIFMPGPSPKQKITQTQMFGNGSIEIILKGDTFDECQRAALEYAETHNMIFIPPFNDLQIIEGQGTVAVEIMEQLPETEVILVPIGGGGLAAGVSFYIKKHFPHVEVIGVEPSGAGCYYAAKKHNKPYTLEKLNKFVDGAAVQTIGSLNFEICKERIDHSILVPEGKVCTSLLELYNKDAIVAEPAGALTVASLSYLQERIQGKKVVCIVSGGNNDIDRMSEIKELSLLHEGLKHYFIVRFPQRPGALKLFVNEVLGPQDDITRFEFIKKTQRERGPALVGIELNKAEDYPEILKKMQELQFDYKTVNDDSSLFEYLI